MSVVETRIETEIESSEGETADRLLHGSLPPPPHLLLNRTNEHVHVRDAPIDRMICNYEPTPCGHPVSVTTC
jgi:hypothetical protein